MLGLRSALLGTCKRTIQNIKYPKFTQNLLRHKHELIPIPSELKTNFPLYPNTSMKLIETELQNMVDRLNDVVKGTKYEYYTLYQTITRSAAAPDDSLIFNLSSQIWNLGFYIQQLSPRQVPIKADLKKILCNNFGSLENFHQKFVSAASSVSGDGWTWIVEDQNGELKFLNTLEAGTPLIPSRMQMTVGLSFETASSHIPSDTTPWTLSPSAPRGAYIPIINFNLWQSGYIADYGHNISKYATVFLNHLDWDRVRSRLICNRDY